MGDESQLPSWALNLADPSLFLYKQVCPPQTGYIITRLWPLNPLAYEELPHADL